MIFIMSPSRGLDIPYDQIDKPYYAAEQETITGGRFRVVKVEKITEPGTLEQYGYRIPAYYLEEITDDDKQMVKPSPFRNRKR